MGDVDRAQLKVALARHYAAQRETAAPEVVDALARAMLVEDRRAHQLAPRMGALAFVAAQVRYIPAWTWLAQAVLVAIMYVLAQTAGSAAATKLAIGLLSIVTVLASVPTLQASKLHGVAELEYSCPHNAANVLVARLVILGCSSALAVAVMVAAAASSLDASAFDVALWACPPYFLSCAGSLLALRKAPPSMAAALCAVWTLACCAVLAAFANSLPDMYANASLAVWAGAAAAAAAWLARELALTVRAVASGLDAFSPHMAQTYN